MTTDRGKWTKSIYRALVCLLAAGALGGAEPSFAGFASTETFLPAVGRIPGKFGAQFYTTIWATNLTGSTVHFTFEFLKEGQANTSPASFTDTLAPGQTSVYENVVETKLGLVNALGAARITSDGEILVAERIYNQEPGDDLDKTEGLFFSGVPKGFSIALGQSASIQGIDQGGTENFRYNFELVETGGASTTVHVVLYDGDGQPLGSNDYLLQPYEQIQPNVDDLAANLATTNARITATVTAGAGSVLLAGAQVANVSQDSSGFEMSFRDDLLGGGGGGGTAGVTSLNGLTGALTIAHGANTTVNVNGSTITIDAVSGSGTGLTAVAHDNSLAGSGTISVPLGIAPGGVGNAQLGGGAITAPKIAAGQVVTSVNGLHDGITLTAGSNVTLTPSGNTLTIAASGGGGGLTLPFSGTTSSSSPGFYVTNTGSGSAVQGSGQGNGAGVYGNNSGSGSGGYFYGTGGQGVVAQSANNHGIEGDAGTPGKAGVYGSGNSYGVWGTSSATLGAGVYGSSPSGTGVEGVGGSNDYAGVTGINTGNGPGVFGNGENGVGVWGQGTTYGVYGVNYLGGLGVYGKSSGSGIGGAAIRADGAGIGLFATNNSSDATIVATNATSGDIFRGFANGGTLVFVVTGAGNVNAHGTFNAGGVDYADRLPAAAGLEPGDVVAIGPEGILQKSNRANDAAVAGVYSTKPGVAGRRESEQRPTVPVALAGVIPVNVTAENGAIAAGDLLVSSSTPGRAMKAPPSPAPGTVIGKAMEPLTSGSGSIEMLVMLR